jgi:quercetin dioxygenase-like cupin family protein
MSQHLLQATSLRQPSLENSFWYNGHTFSFLLTAEQTAGALALIHCHLRKGGEPPAHYHKQEDETFYVIEGEMRFHVGENRFMAKAGDLVHVPKMVPHQFTLVTDTAKALLLINPCGAETFFQEFGTPALSLDLPPVMEGKPPAQFFDNMMRRAEELGMVWMPEF